MDNGFQFIDIIFFAMLAAFLVLRLRGVLGRRDGHEGGHRDPFTQGRKQEPADDTIIRLPDANGAPTEAEPVADDDTPVDALTEGIAAIRAADRGFDPTELVSGARVAFEMILGAYASGDSKALKPLLSNEVFANFDMSIREREKAGETMEDTLIGIKTADVVEAYLEGRVAQVTVKFVSEQVNVIRDAEGKVVDGDPNAVVEVTDFWTFAKDTKSRDPNWTLVATRSLD
jgi:predicted lipid-binding transport protein (Tim44 family)